MLERWPPVLHPLESLVGRTQLALGGGSVAREQLERAGLEGDASKGELETELLRQRLRARDQIPCGAEASAHRLEVTTYAQNVYVQQAVRLRARAEGLGPGQSRADRHRAHEHRRHHELEALGLLCPLAGIPCVTRRALEILDRRRGLATPEAQLSGQAERTRQPRFVAELPVEGECRLQLAPDHFLPGALLRGGVQPQDGQRHDRVGGHHALA